MRITLFILFVWIIQVLGVNTEAQNRMISLPDSEVSVGELFSAIEEQADLLVLYRDWDIDIHRFVRLTRKSDQVTSLLNLAFENTGIRYEIVNKYIVLLPPPENRLQQNRQKQVSGKVTDLGGEAIIGANIVEKGTTNGTVTDSEGNYNLNISDNATLLFSYIGYIPQEVVVGNRSVVSVRLEEDAQSLDEIVIIGYGTVRKTDLTGAVSSVKNNDIKSQGVSNVTHSLQGKIPGVTIESAGGTPGAGTRVLIRGIGTFGNANPLYLVDGVPVDNISNIPAGDIESMNILKDASAAAIYGSRAANGVVLVTTKSGLHGTPKISFDANVGFQKIIKKLNVLNAQEWATVSNAAHDAAGLARLDIAQDPASLGKGTDWQEAIFRTAPIQQYQLGIAGGTDAVKYSISGGYNTQKGIVQTTGYDRYNIRLKNEITRGIFKIGETLMLVRQKWDNNSLSVNWGSRASAIGASLVMIPAFSVYNPDAIGGYDGVRGSVVNIGNPLAQLNLEDQYTAIVNLINNTFVEVSVLPYLTYKFNVGYTKNFTNNYDYQHRYDVGSTFSNPTNNLSETKTENSTILLENTLSLDKSIGKNRIQVLAGYSYQKYDYAYWWLNNKDLPDGIYVLDAARSAASAGGNKSESVLLSMLGRVIYSFDNKYLLTATFRRDGSSRFAASNRFGNFPSVAAGWNIYKESFFKDWGLERTITNLKLRGSYGVLGNQEIGNYLYNSSISSNIKYLTGTDQHKWVGAIQTGFASPDIRWETTQTFNVGLDVSFLNKLAFTADWFNKNTYDILLNIPIPISTGATSNPTMNAGK
ncbi:MAG: SusC/RagA family TonB-linked outer membrane protein, partial [Tannerellaceae bacterium]|nr:SusC/RagA family TonB-linked outer membrane protein [Tannerellaceae bacterium]